MSDEVVLLVSDISTDQVTTLHSSSSSHAHVCLFNVDSGGPAEDHGAVLRWEVLQVQVS
jgi:hypothetical protein